jgi:hypothetical protein
MANTDFDVFLSHNSRDKPAVRALARHLTLRGIRVWLDEDELIPGRNWQPLLEQGITRSRAGAVVVGKDGLGPWEDEEMQALLRQAVDQGKPVIPVLLPSAPDRPALPLFLASRTWVDLRGGFTEEGLDRLVWGITGARPDTPMPADATPTRRPYLWTLGGLLLALVIGLAAWLTSTPSEQVLAGAVRNAAGDPLAGVEVSLPAYGATATTDARGRFELRVKVPEKHQSVKLMARAEGYRTHHQYATLGNTGLEFAMTRRAP